MMMIVRMKMMVIVNNDGDMIKLIYHDDTNTDDNIDCDARVE